MQLKFWNRKKVLLLIYRIASYELVSRGTRSQQIHKLLAISSMFRLKRLASLRSEFRVENEPRVYLLFRPTKCEVTKIFDRCLHPIHGVFDFWWWVRNMSDRVDAPQSLKVNRLDSSLLIFEILKVSQIQIAPVKGRLNWDDAWRSEDKASKMLKECYQESYAHFQFHTCHCLRRS